MTAPVTRSRSYFEDVEVDSRHETPGMTVTEAHVAMYAGLTGDSSMVAGAAPDLLGLALSTGLGWRIDRAPLMVLAFMGIEWTIRRPLRVGDTIRSRSRTAMKRGMRDAGVIMEEHAIVDQHGQVLQEGKFTFLVAKRPA